MSIAAVILAGGASTRLGEPKQLVMLAGERLLERAVRIATEAGCVSVMVVLGAGADAIRAACALGSARIVVNEGWAEGMASSVRAGVASLSPLSDAVILMTSDQPAVTADHLQKLMNAGDGPVASSYAGRRGVPAYFPRRCFTELLGLSGDAGAKRLLEAAPTIDLAGGELDVDTREALEAARSVYD